MSGASAVPSAGALENLTRVDTEAIALRNSATFPEAPAVDPDGAEIDGAFHAGTWLSSGTRCAMALSSRAPSSDSGTISSLTGEDAPEADEVDASVGQLGGNHLPRRARLRAPRGESGARMHSAHSAHSGSAGDAWPDPG